MCGVMWSASDTACFSLLAELEDLGLAGGIVYSNPLGECDITFHTLDVSIRSESFLKRITGVIESASQF